jgi:hypothetical protein
VDASFGPVVAILRMYDVAATKAACPHRNARRAGRRKSLFT